MNAIIYSVFGVVILLACTFGFEIMVRIRNRRRLIENCGRRLTEAYREALFDNKLRALTKMRIVARECPVSLEDLGIEEHELSLIKHVAARYMTKYDGKNYYV